MTVLLVLATFAVFLAIDYFHSRKRAVQPVIRVESEPVSLLGLPPAFAGGFEIRDNLAYHPGHTWALSESPSLVRVGLDDFAVRLIGKVQGMVLPKRGQWIRQGQKIATVFRDGGKAELVSPIEGEVTNINEALLEDTGLLRRDPYGEGWLVTVQSPDAKTNFRNLLRGGLARRWMEEASNALRSHMPALAGAVAQDGGVAADDLANHLPGQAWSELTREFFLT
jgi:glycine cleavage system H lipoate-binding protein